MCRIVEKLATGYSVVVKGSDRFIGPEFKFQSGYRSTQSPPDRLKDTSVLNHSYIIYCLKKLLQAVRNPFTFFHR